MVRKCRRQPDKKYTNSNSNSNVKMEETVSGKREEESHIQPKPKLGGHEQDEHTGENIGSPRSHRLRLRNRSGHVGDSQETKLEYDPDYVETSVGQSSQGKVRASPRLKNNNLINEKCEEVKSCSPRTRLSLRKDQLQSTNNSQSSEVTAACEEITSYRKRRHSERFHTSSQETVDESEVSENETRQRRPRNDKKGI